MKNEAEGGIPKIIHYCWFGPNKMKALQRECINSWKRTFHDYDFIKWDESNVEMDHPFLQTAYHYKKWAFVADYVRLQKLNEYGGIYLDTDMLVLKPLDKFLNEICFLGAEDENFINAGIIGTAKNHPFLRLCLDRYNEIDVGKNLTWSEITIPRLLTKEFRNTYDYFSQFDQIIRTKNTSVFPPSFFYPLPYLQKGKTLNYEPYLTSDSYTVHLWDESWIDFNEFQHFRKGNYWKGLKKVLCKIYRDKNVDIKYLKKNLSAVKESITE